VLQALGLFKNDFQMPMLQRITTESRRRFVFAGQIENAAVQWLAIRSITTSYEYIHSFGMAAFSPLHSVEVYRASVIVCVGRILVQLGVEWSGQRLIKPVYSPWLAVCGRPVSLRVMEDTIERMDGYWSVKVHPSDADTANGRLPLVVFLLTSI